MGIQAGASFVYTLIQASCEAEMDVAFWTALKPSSNHPAAGVTRSG
jgi:hypothetical protein